MYLTVARFRRIGSVAWVSLPQMQGSAGFRVVAEFVADGGAPCQQSPIVAVVKVGIGGDLPEEEVRSSSVEQAK